MGLLFSLKGFVQGFHEGIACTVDRTIPNGLCLGNLKKKLSSPIFPFVERIGTPKNAFTKDRTALKGEQK